MIKQVLNEAAGDDKTGGVTSGDVEDLVEPRTKLRALFQHLSSVAAFAA